MIGVCFGDSTVRGACFGDSTVRGACFGDSTVRGACCGDSTVQGACCGDSTVRGVHAGPMCTLPCRRVQHKRTHYVPSTKHTTQHTKRSVHPIPYICTIHKAYITAHKTLSTSHTQKIQCTTYNTQHILCMCMNPCMHTHMHTCAHTHVYTHAHTHTHTHPEWEVQLFIYANHEESSRLAYVCHKLI